MLQKSFKFLLEHYPTLLFVLIYVAGMSIFVVYISKPEAADWLRGYFQRSVTEMSVGEFVLWVWFLMAVFSKKK